MSKPASRVRASSAGPHLELPQPVAVPGVGGVAGDQRAVEVEEGAYRGALWPSLDVLDQAREVVHSAPCPGIRRLAMRWITASRRSTSATSSANARRDS